MRVLAMGVGDDLEHAETDARRIARYFAHSALAPRARAELLTGPLATCSAVRNRLALLRWRSTPLLALLLFFSGHGSREGIWLADGMLSYIELARLLRATGIERILVILDTCHAGASTIIGSDGKIASVSSDFLAAMAAAAPGVRILASARAEEFSYESPLGGRFTSAFLRATECASTDMPGASTWLASDAEVFRLTKKIMERRWGRVQTPTSYGPLGDFPLAQTQDRAVVGAVAIGPMVPSGEAAMSALVSFTHRQLVPCQARLLVLDHRGQVLARDDGAEDIIRPDSRVHRRMVTRTARLVSAVAAAEFRMHTAIDCPVRWRLEIVDSHGAVIAQKDWYRVGREVA